MAAALQLTRARRWVLIVDAGQRRNRFAEHSHGFLTQDGAPPGAIAERAREQLLRYPTVTWIEGTVTAAALARDGFEVQLEAGERHGGRRLVLATSVADELPDTVERMN
jgi:thioredoxin reductase